MSPVWKLADEIPMIMISSHLTVCFSKHVFKQLGYIRTARKGIGIVFGVYLFTTVFIDATNVDPSEITFRALFMIPFGLILLLNVYIFRSLHLLIPEEGKRESVKTCAKMCLTSSLIAGAAWLIDAKACYSPIVAYFQLHTFWHIGVSITAYLLVCIVACLKPYNTIEWRCNMCPLVVENAVEYLSESLSDKHKCDVELV